MPVATTAATIAMRHIQRRRCLRRRQVPPPTLTIAATLVGTPADLLGAIRPVAIPHMAAASEGISPAAIFLTTVFEPVRARRGALSSPALCLLAPSVCSECDERAALAEGQAEVALPFVYWGLYPQTVSSVHTAQKSSCCI